MEPNDSHLYSVSLSSSESEDESLEYLRQQDDPQQSGGGEPSSSPLSRSNSPVSESSEPVLHPAVSSGDSGKVVQLKASRELTDHEKLTLLTKHFVPPHNYKFPARSIGGHNRHFQQSWLDQHNWLAYSESEDGGYCKYCVLFARDGPIMELGVFINRPLIDFKRVTDKLHDHFHNKKFHKMSIEAASTFTLVMKNLDLATDHRLSSERSKRAAENHCKLLSIAETVIFCG